MGLFMVYRFLTHLGAKTRFPQCNMEMAVCKCTYNVSLHGP